MFHFTLDPYHILLSVKQGGIKYHFGVFGVTRPGIEYRSSGPLANTLTIMPISQVGRMFANGPGDLSSIPGGVIPKTLKMVLDASLLNTQQYKVHIKGKVEQSSKRSSAIPYTSV